MEDADQEVAGEEEVEVVVMEDKKEFEKDKKRWIFFFFCFYRRVYTYFIIQSRVGLYWKKLISIFFF